MSRGIRARNVALLSMLVIAASAPAAAGAADAPINDGDATEIGEDEIVSWDDLCAPMETSWSADEESQVSGGNDAASSLDENDPAPTDNDGPIDDIGPDAPGDLPDDPDDPLFQWDEEWNADDDVEDPCAAFDPNNGMGDKPAVTPGRSGPQADRSVPKIRHLSVDGAKRSRRGAAPRVKFTLTERAVVKLTFTSSRGRKNRTQTYAIAGRAGANVVPVPAAARACLAATTCSVALTAVDAAGNKSPSARAKPTAAPKTKGSGKSKGKGKKGKGKGGKRR